MSEFSVVDDAIGSLRAAEVNCAVHGRSFAASIMGRELRCLRCIEDGVSMDAGSRLREQEVVAEKRRLEVSLHKSGIPERYWGATFDRYHLREDNPDQVNIVSQLRLFAGMDCAGWRSIVLFGTPGTGKTHLAASVMLELIARGSSVKYLSFPALMDRFSRSRSFSAGFSREDLLNEVVAPDLLVIDEVGLIGSVSADDQMLAAAYDVINARYNALKPVIICTNGSISELRLVLGERVFERLRENNGRFLKMDWVSFRKAGA